MSPILVTSVDLSAGRKAADACAAEVIKREMRARYWDQTVRRAPARPISLEEHWERAANFWADYEDVNLRLCPDDPVYSVTRAGTAPATSADFWGVQSAASGQMMILESVVQGEATATTINRWQVQRTTGVVGGGVTITPEPFNTFSAAAQGTARSGGTAALTGAPLITHAFNAFSGSDRWLPAPGEEIEAHSGGNIVCRPASGAGTASGYVVFEEK